MPNVPELVDDSNANLDSFESLEFIGAEDPNLGSISAI
jgi:hypothetical protein